MLLSAHDLTVRLNGRLVLSDVNFTINAGEIVTIVGPNGSGKTTLLRSLIGAIRPDAGSVTRMRGLRIGYVPQRLSIDATLPLTVERFLNLPRRRSASAVREGLDRAGVPGVEKQQLADLSGGQFQRVPLARAVLEDPHLLVLDEATAGLDQVGEAAFYTRIAGLREDLGCAVLMVSHDLHVVMSASDRVVCLNGHVCCEGAPDLVASAPEYRALFGTGTKGALALYRHRHDHAHDHTHDHGHDHDHGHAHDNARQDDTAGVP